MFSSKKRYLIFEVRDGATAGSPQREHPWAEYLRADLQPTTTMTMVAIIMIFYTRVVGC
jgi:hypothetical protein